MAQSCFIEALDPIWTDKPNYFEMGYYNQRPQPISKSSVSTSQLELIGTALREALDHCATYHEQDYFEISFYETRKKGRRHYFEPLYLSSLPVQVLDEIELDQEIDLIEEEIARIQEQKKLLKRTAAPRHQYRVSTGADADQCAESSEEDDDLLVVEEVDDEDDMNNSNNNEEYGSSEEDEDEYLPNIHYPITSPKNLKRKRSKSSSNITYETSTINSNNNTNASNSNNNDRRRKRKENQNRNDYSSSQDSSPSSSSSSSNPSIELQFSICTLNSPPPKKSSSSLSSPSSSTSIQRSSTSSSHSNSKTKRQEKRVFQIEEILKIQPIIISTKEKEEEEEDIDILN